MQYRPTSHWKNATFRGVLGIMEYVLLNEITPLKHWKFKAFC